MVTTELRKDPFTGRSVLIDLVPRKRRNDFDLEPVRLDDPPQACPLCEGREAVAGPEVLSWREGGSANGPGWSVRVIPSPDSMLRIEGATAVRHDGLFEARDGLGAHEVVVETPVHDQALHTLSAEGLWRVLWAWRTRLHDLKRDSRFAAAVVFKNHGRAAGARMDHAHSQIAAYPIVPPVLEEKVRGAEVHFKREGRCIFCDVIKQELRDGRRTVSDTEAIIAIAPYASRVPFETWLLPRSHEAAFEAASDATLRAMAVVLSQVMGRIDWALERPAYNLALHSAPFGGEAAKSFHWHLEIVPRVTRVGGQEWGSGVPRNPVAPEEAARVLRAVATP